MEIVSLLRNISVIYPLNTDRSLYLYFSLAHGTCFKAILVVLLSYYMADTRILKTNDRLTLAV